MAYTNSGRGIWGREVCTVQTVEYGRAWLIPIQTVVGGVHAVILELFLLTLDYIFTTFEIATNSQDILWGWSIWVCFVWDLSLFFCGIDWWAECTSCWTPFVGVMYKDDASTASACVASCNKLSNKLKKEHKGILILTKISSIYRNQRDVGMGRWSSG